jgi:phosphate transport system permease protein
MYAKRLLVNRIMMAFSVLCTAFGVLFLFWIISDLVIHGLRFLNPRIFVVDTPGPNDSGGGLRNALIGSLMIVFWCMIFSIPVGVLAGTWLSEYGKNGKLANTVRFVNQVLLSAPSIVLGVFIYSLMVYPKGLLTLGGFSGWAGACALCLIAVPKMVVTTENILNLVPEQMREAAFALGAPKSRVITTVAYRAAMSGIVTGMLLAFAQVFGETAPLLFTSLGNQFLSLDMAHPMAALPPVIYSFAMSPYDRWKELAWAGSFIIAAVVLSLNILVRSTLKQSKT